MPAALQLSDFGHASIELLHPVQSVLVVEPSLKKKKSFFRSQAHLLAQ
jgi:hypothetical protein